MHNFVHFYFLFFVHFNYIIYTKQLILNRSYSVQYGARPVKRFLQKEIETRLSRLIIEGKVKDGSMIIVTVKNNEIDLIIE